MKMVAAAKLRRAQDRITQTRPYAKKLQEVVARLVNNNSVSNPLLRVADHAQHILFIVVGSDRGLCGGFNNNLFKVVENTINEQFSDYKENNRLSLITVGKKATSHFKKRDYHIIDSFPGFFDNIEYASASSIMQDAFRRFIKKETDQVFVAYNEFKSVIAQNRKVQQVLPIDPSTLSSGDASVDAIDYIYEPSPDLIIDELLPLHLNMQLWKAVLDSNAAEQGARMTAMDNATENAKDLKRELQLKYNQARQSAITTEISEIVSGAQALDES